MLHNPYKIVKMFEEEVAHYTGAPYAISVNSSTNALLLCCKYFDVEEVTIPARTYLSVPQSVLHAGGTVKFDERKWKGVYQLKPYPIYDAAKRFTSGMYIPGSFMCLSFHIKKHLKIGKGGMILLDNKEAVDWFRAMRYEGRHEVNYHDDDIDLNGYNMYVTPTDAARGLMLMQNIPPHNDDLLEDPPYKDLREFKLFKRNNNEKS